MFSTDTLAGRMIAYMKAPFTEEPKPFDWLWFVFFIILVSLFWNFILRHIYVTVTKEI